MNESIQPTEGEWKYYDWGVDDNGERDSYIVSERGYAVVRCPRYQTREQWQADAKLIVQSKRMASLLNDILDCHSYGEIHLTPKLLERLETTLRNAGMLESKHVE